MRSVPPPRCTSRERPLIDMSVNRLGSLGGLARRAPVSVWEKGRMLTCDQIAGGDVNRLTEIAGFSPEAVQGSGGASPGARPITRAPDGSSVLSH